MKKIILDYFFDENTDKRSKQLFFNTVFVIVPIGVTIMIIQKIIFEIFF